MAFFTALLDLLFPPKCVFCRRLLGDGDTWCARCAGKLPLTVNGGRQDGDFFDFCISPMYYKDAVRKSILRYKFSGASHYAETYGKILASCIRAYMDARYDLISWVPLNTKRERARGYDQAMLLAMATALELDGVAVQTLDKPRDVAPQSGLGGKAERRANISGAYEVCDTELIDGKRVLLIDDIVTTGSTLEECAKALLTAGATGVVCAALARSVMDS
jgi:ComF family protein